jgi:hypothetical protein
MEYDDLSPNQKKVVDFMVIPAWERDERTWEELAEKIGVTSKTLRKWRKDFPLAEIANDMVKKNLVSHIGPVLNSMAKAAETGSHQDRRLFLEYMKEFSPTLTVNYSVDTELSERIRLARERVEAQEQAIIVEAEIIQEIEN